jgi:hypothetical protein
MSAPPANARDACAHAKERPGVRHPLNARRGFRREVGEP